MEREGTLEVKMEEVVAEMIEEEQGEEPVWIPWNERELEQVREAIEGGQPCIFSDASVKNDKKAVAVWFGQKGSEEGKMLTCPVEGVPHDSGRAELVRPVVALRTLI